MTSYGTALGSGGEGYSFSLESPSSLQPPPSPHPIYPLLFVCEISRHLLNSCFLAPGGLGKGGGIGGWRMERVTSRGSWLAAEAGISQSPLIRCTREGSGMRAGHRVNDPHVLPRSVFLMVSFVDGFEDKGLPTVILGQLCAEPGIKKCSFLQSVTNHRCIHHSAIYVLFTLLSLRTYAATLC